MIKERENRRGISEMDLKDFKRCLSDEKINELKDFELFRVLVNDKNVFPAIRNNAVDFYYKGGRIFRYENGSFKTHQKYVPYFLGKSADSNFYIDENDLLEKTKKETVVGKRFSCINVLERIKENSYLFSGAEAEGVSDIYGKYSYLYSKTDVVVLDVEISFKSEDIQCVNEEKEDNKRGVKRIDLLLLNKKKNKLRFAEVKRFTNDDIRKKPQPVVRQINEYSDILKNDENKFKILREYGEYVKILNKLFVCDLREPTDLDANVMLIVFGYDVSQKSRLEEEYLYNNGWIKFHGKNNAYNMEGIVAYIRGDSNKINIDDVWI